MQDRPTVDELLDAVEGFLREDLGAILEGQPRFHARVAANAVAIVRRELAGGAALAEAERDRLVALLGEEGDVGRLNGLLADEIRAGRRNDPATLEHLRQTAREKLRVANPKYREER
jgi:hypothetical protein